MEQLTARAVVHDMMLVHGRSKKEIDRYIKTSLARNLSEELVRHNIDEITVQRPFYYGYDPINRGGTEYEMKVFVLSKDEYEEFKDLKEFQKRMKEFVKQ
jgi:hypothetical protein